MVFNDILNNNISVISFEQYFSYILSKTEDIGIFDKDITKMF